MIVDEITFHEWSECLVQPSLHGASLQGEGEGREAVALNGNSQWWAHRDSRSGTCSSKSYHLHTLQFICCKGCAYMQSSGWGITSSKVWAESHQTSLRVKTWNDDRGNGTGHLSWHESYPWLHPEFVEKKLLKSMKRISTDLFLNVEVKMKEGLKTKSRKTTNRKSSFHSSILRGSSKEFALLRMNSYPQSGNFLRHLDESWITEKLERATTIGVCIVQHGLNPIPLNSIAVLERSHSRFSISFATSDILDDNVTAHHQLQIGTP